MNILQRQAISILTQSLRKGSKWYAEDMAHIRKHVSQLSTQQLRQIIARQTAINNVGQAEINSFCQLPF